MTATPSRGLGRGGARTGAGRPRGSVNGATRAFIAEARAAGTRLPLDFLLQIMNDDNAPMRERIYCGVAALPFCHARLVVERVAVLDPDAMSDAELLQSIKDLERIVGEADAEPAAPVNAQPGAVRPAETWEPPPPLPVPLTRPGAPAPSPAPEGRHLRFDPAAGRLKSVSS